MLYICIVTVFWSRSGNKLNLSLLFELSLFNAAASASSSARTTVLRHETEDDVTCLLWFMMPTQLLWSPVGEQSLISSAGRLNHITHTATTYSKYKALRLQE